MARPIIIDCDPGQDDAVALFLAMSSPDELEILGITTVAGNVPLELTQRNARMMCDIAGRKNALVFAGCNKPMRREAITAEYIHGNTGIDGVTLQLILGKVFRYLMFLLSVPWAEAEAAGALFGEKIILNEFVAFSHLNEYLAGMSPRTVAITTFSLCGFANLSSIAILLGGLGVLVPEKRELIGVLGIKAVLAASLSNLMSAALAGLLLTF